MFSDSEILRNGVVVSFDEFRRNILTLAENRNPNVRKGQFVYNHCALKYLDAVMSLHKLDGFFLNVDCYYNDRNIDAYLEKVYCYIRENPI